jgi:hypothetical protein
VNSRWLYLQVHGRLPARSTPSARRRSGPARSYKYRAWIRALPCAVCGTIRGIEAAHTGKDGGMSQVASDYSCIPLCDSCHRTGPSAYHRIGRREFEERHGLDLAGIVRRLNSAWFQFSGLVK